MPEFAAKIAGLRVRQAVVGDAAAVADLFVRAEPDFPLDGDAYARMWEWLHWRNTVRASDVLVAEDEAGSLQGHVAMLPVSFHAGSSLVVAGWPCQLMVDDRWRHSLLYASMVQQVLSFCGSRGYEFAYALINRPRVLKANGALGLRPVGEVPIWARPYRPADILGKTVSGPWGKFWARLGQPVNALGRFALPRAARGIAVEAIERFEPEIDEMFRTTLTPAYRYVSERNAAVLNWRFFGLPERRYGVFVARENGRIVGYVAFRAMPMRAFASLAIADIWHHPAVPAAGHALMAAVHRAAIAEGVDLAACAMPERSPMAGLLRKHSFLKSPESFTLTVYRPRRGRPRDGEAPMGEWHTTWYDHDYV